MKKLTELSPKLSEIKQRFYDPSDKKEHGLADWQHREKGIRRNQGNDRVHPVPTVIINTHDWNHGTDLGDVKMIYGPNSDEYTRSHHALALVVANTIFFRNGAYRPETEEGRKLLAHELTHIAQNKDMESYRNTTKAEMEAEAEQAEKIEKLAEQEIDPLITRKLGHKSYTLKKSVWQRIIRKAFSELESDIMRAKSGLNGNEYLELLLKYQKWLKEDKKKWEL